MNRLKPRLKKIATLIELDSIVVDIGTDHGYLPLYLIQQGISPQVIATELLTKGLKEVKKQKEYFGLREELQLRQGDGFSALLEEDSPHIAVIAGMGGRTIAELIERGALRAASLKYMLLQPMRDLFLLRSWLQKNGFYIISEHLALENSLFFEIIKVGVGKNEDVGGCIFPREVGAALLRSGDPLLVPYLQNKLKRCRQVLTSLESAVQERAIEKKNYYKGLEKYLEELLLTVS